MATRRIPAYTDGAFDLYRTEERAIPGTDAARTVLVNQHMRIWYHEVSVFDTLRTAMQQAGREVTMKIRIPQYRLIDTRCYVKIEGAWHRVFNSAQILRDGFRETELTLVAPETMYPEVDE